MKVKLKSDVISQIIAKKNISQNGVAKYIGTSNGYFSQMMTGKRNPSPKMREKILKYLNDYKFDDLFKLWKGKVIIKRKSEPVF